MWRQDDLFAVLNRTAELRYPGEGDPAEVRADAGRAPASTRRPACSPGPPSMHGTGLFTAMSTLSSAGSVIMPASRRFDVEELLDVDPGRAGHRAVHRRRRLRQAHPGRPGRPPGPLGHLVVVADHQLRGDVVGRGQGRLAAPPSPAAHGRHPRLVRGASAWPAPTPGWAPPRPPPASSSGPTPGCSPRTAGRSSPGPASRAGSPCGAAGPIGLLQGSREVRGHLPDDRRRAVDHPWRLRHRGRRTAPSACSAGAPAASTPAARRSSPRRSRRPSSSIPPWRTPWSSGTPDDRFGEGRDRRGGAAAWRRTLDEAAAHRLGSGPAGGLQGSPAGRGRRHHRPVPERQGRLRPLRVYAVDALAATIRPPAPLRWRRPGPLGSGAGLC